MSRPVSSADVRALKAALVRQVHAYTRAIGAPVTLTRADMRLTVLPDRPEKRTRKARI